jgi:excisionase family DNA binding protein
MKFSPDELAEIRTAFRQRLKREPTHKQLARRKARLEPPPAFVREPDYDDAEILRPGDVAELFGVSTRIVGKWADAGTLPSFRTLGGHRRYRWANVKRWLNGAGTAAL